MSRFRLMIRTDTEEVYRFSCPGCGCSHQVRVRGTGALWHWNGDVDRPTLRPSVRVLTDNGVCHSFVREGQILFLPDCTHALAGQTVDLPEF